MASLCRWLLEDFKSQMAMAKTLGVPQSAISGYLSARTDSAIPEDDTKQLFVAYLRSGSPKEKRCDKWDIAEFTRYLDSELPPAVFLAWLRDKPISPRMSVKELVSGLTDAERLEFIELVIHDLKKNTLLVAA